MAHLTDMEELLAKIESFEIREYMKEAMSCYMANAYRGCIVMSYIALFDDVFEKLAELAKVNAKAKDIYDQASKKKNDQEVFESFLIDKLSAESFISGLDSSFLGTLRTLRNKSAHPSGHKPSAEEARFIYFEAINRFMSKPILTTNQLIDELVIRLKNANFFPSNDLNDIASVVKEELELLHEAAIPQLIAKISNATLSTDKNEKKNASFFISGLSSLGTEAINNALVSSLINKKSDDDEFSLLIIRIISANGEIINKINGVTLNRVKKIIVDRIDKFDTSLLETRLTHPANLLRSISRSMPDPKFSDNFNDALKAFYKKRPFSKLSLKVLLTHKKARDIYFSEFNEMAGSSQFDVANPVADGLSGISMELSNVLTNRQSLELIVSLVISSNYGAWGPEGLKNNKFDDISEIKEKALIYIKDNKDESDEILSTKLGMNSTAFVSKHLSVDQ